MSEALNGFLWWVVTWPHLVWRVPAVIVGALLTWAIWMWLWTVFWPWARLVLKILGKLLGRVAEVLDWVPERSKAAVAYLEHLARVCEKYDCPHHKERA